jgi:hypothetical protein
MSKTKINRAFVRKVEALRLLRSARFFRLFLDAVRTAGLVGEQKNALVVFVVGVSRLLSRPVNLFIKGASSAGKNYLAKTVLQFFPKKCVEEISSSSGTSWNYQGGKLQHRIVYIQEQNKAAGNIHPARLLISENELVRTVTVRTLRGFETKREITKGPIACISTTTKDRVEIDDETRHVSIQMDASAEQTKRIIEAQLNPTTGISQDELAIWHEVQNLLKARARLPIEFGDWTKQLVDEVWTGDVRVRRYFNAFMEVCKAVCLVRSFRLSEEEITERGKLKVSFIDFATAHLIFESALSQSLSYADDEDREVHKAIAQISQRKKGAGVEAAELATQLGIQRHEAYERIRRAVERKLVRRVNPPQRGNKKLYLPTEEGIEFIPDPEHIFKKIAHPGRRLKFVHPLTGEVVIYPS